MKKQTLLILTLLIHVVLISCEKDESSPEVDSSFIRIDDQSSELDKVLLMNWGTYNGIDEAYEGYRIIIGLYSPDVKIVSSNGEVESFNGIGYGAEFEVFVSEPQKIPSFVFSQSSQYKINTFSFGVVYDNFNFGTGEMLDGKFFKAGTLTIQASEELLNFQADISLVGGEVVKISYSGLYLYLEPSVE